FFRHAGIMLERHGAHAIILRLAADGPNECGDSARIRAPFAQSRNLCADIEIRLLDTNHGGSSPRDIVQLRRFGQACDEQSIGRARNARDAALKTIYPGSWWLVMQRRAEKG